MRVQGKLGEHLSTTQLVSLLIILVTTAVVFILIANVRLAVDKSASANCAAAVQNAGLQNKIYGREAGAPITGCNTENIAINMSSLPTDKDAASTEIKHRLASAMLKCWTDWGAGKLDLFNEAGDYCNVCSVITFDDKVKANISSVNDFSDYLKSTDALPGKKYQSLLQGSVTNVDLSPKALDETQKSISTNQPVAVLFWYSRNKGAQSIMEQVFGVDIPPSRVAGITGTLTSALLLTSGVGVLMNAQVSGLSEALAYGYARFNEDWYTLSATYIIPYDQNNEYVKQCNKAANIITSP